VREGSGAAAALDVGANFFDAFGGGIRATDAILSHRWCTEEAAKFETFLCVVIV